ncbi:hypothetical protein [uncultured Tenacibaculum sp.]|uniref:hypothetical protein n=1 Tax=uncultured Tenacibaculum sp. TaxID=174713 RepID=UPI0026343D6C|nr:hypothetical protein [uncultured Tenacibaculum sp.]
MKKLKNGYKILAKKVFLFIGAISILTSCEYSYRYSYRITNKSNSIVGVHLKTFNIDSTYIIPNDSTILLFNTTHGIESFGGPYFDDVKNDIDELIVKMGKGASNRDFLKNENWSFDKGKGTYSTIIKKSDFDK